MRVPSQSDNLLATMSAAPAKAAGSSKGAGQDFPGLIKAAKAPTGPDVPSLPTIIAEETKIDGTVPAVITTEAMPFLASTLKVTPEAKTAVSKASTNPVQTDDPLAETTTEFSLIAMNMPGAPAVPARRRADGLGGSSLSCPIRPSVLRPDMAGHAMTAPDRGVRGNRGWLST